MKKLVALGVSALFGLMGYSYATPAATVTADAYTAYDGPTTTELETDQYHYVHDHYYDRRRRRRMRRRRRRRPYYYYYQPHYRHYRPRRRRQRRRRHHQRYYPHYWGGASSIAEGGLEPTVAGMSTDVIFDK